MSNPEHVLFTGIEEYLRGRPGQHQVMISHQYGRPNKEILLHQLHFFVMEHLIAYKSSRPSMDEAMRVKNELEAILPVIDGMTFFQALQEHKYTTDVLLAVLDVFQQCVGVITLDRREHVGVSHTVNRNKHVVRDQLVRKTPPGGVVCVSTPGPKNDSWLREAIQGGSPVEDRAFFNVWTGQGHDAPFAAAKTDVPEGTTAIIREGLNGPEVEPVVDTLMDAQAWAELHRLRAESVDANGIRWYDHAVNERHARQKLQREYNALKASIENGQRSEQ